MLGVPPGWGPTSLSRRPHWIASTSPVTAVEWCSAPTNAGGAIQVHLFRPVPSRLALLGGLYLAMQLSLRAAATGEVVVVTTGRPAAWAAILRAFDSSDHSTDAPV